MSVEQKDQMVREAVGVFKGSAVLQAAIDELLASGFDRAELSLLASEQVRGIWECDDSCAAVTDACPDHAPALHRRRHPRALRPRPHPRRRSDPGRM